MKLVFYVPRKFLQYHAYGQRNKLFVIYINFITTFQTLTDNIILLDTYIVLVSSEKMLSNKKMDMYINTINDCKDDGII